MLSGIVVLAIWSLAGFWGFPDAFPDSFTLRSWIRFGPGTLEALGETAVIAGTAALIALILTIGCLEAEYRYGLSFSTRAVWLLYLPLLRPVLTALAVGLAVSVGQYLPTLLIGGGRVATLMTEAVALASDGDRRAIAVYGLAQTGAALVLFALALLIPAMVWRNRRGLRHG